LPDDDTNNTGTGADGGADNNDDTEAQRLLADAIGSDSDTDDDDADTAELTARLERFQKEAAKWKELARKHEGRARQNADAASKAKSVEDQLDEMRKQIADRDVADVARNGRMAMTQVQAKLAEAGFSRADVSGLLELIDPVTLLSDGEPSDSAIDKLAKSLIKVAGKATPDRDQGRRGGSAPINMNQLIRRKAGIGNS
jgi:hypothetical protein